MTDVKSVYEVIGGEADPMKIRLTNCPWEGIVFVYTKIEAGNALDQNGNISAKFDYQILDESEGFSIDMFKLDHQMIEFENLLGRILKDVLADLYNAYVQDTNKDNDNETDDRE